VCGVVEGVGFRAQLNLEWELGPKRTLLGLGPDQRREEEEKARTKNYLPRVKIISPSLLLTTLTPCYENRG
jgi:hypothetical protein